MKTLQVNLIEHANGSASKSTSSFEPESSSKPGLLRMYLDTLSYKTRERLELINITKDLNEVIRKNGLKAGFLHRSLHQRIPTGPARRHQIFRRTHGRPHGLLAA